MTSLGLKVVVIFNESSRAIPHIFSMMIMTDRVDDISQDYRCLLCNARLPRYVQSKKSCFRELPGRYVPRTVFAMPGHGYLDGLTERN